MKGRIRWLWIAGLVLGIGCTSLEPEGASLESPESAERDEADVAGGSAPSGGIAAKTAEVIEQARSRNAAEEAEQDAASGPCGPQIDPPTLVLADAVEIRPPLHVEFLPDDNPVFAQAVMSGGFVSACDGIVKRVMVTTLAAEPDKPLEELVHEMVTSLEEQGYTDGVQRAVLRGSDEHHVAYEYPEADGNPATMLYVAGVHRKSSPGPTTADDDVLIAVFETEPAEFERLQPTFRASASSLRPRPKP